MSSNQSQTRAGLFVPTTNVWDVQQIQSVNVNSQEFKELLVRLYQNINNITIALNLKDSGYYDTTQFVTGQLFFPGTFIPNQYRQVQRLVVNFGTLPNATVKSVPHGITVNPNTTFTRIYGVSTKNDQNSFLPLPYVNLTLNQCIQLDVDANNVNITTGINYSNWTTTYVVLEYLQT